MGKSCTFNFSSILNLQQFHFFEFNDSMRTILIFSLVVFFHITKAQYGVQTNQYKLGIAQQEDLLTEEIESLPDLNYYFFPQRQFLYANSYTFDFLSASSYRIGLLIDPCRYNSYNCCMNGILRYHFRTLLTLHKPVFGSAEYPAALKSGIEQERYFKYIVISNESEISSNYYLVYEDGSKVLTTADRTADDDSVYDLSCVSKSVPTSNCQGRNYALQRSVYR